MKKVEFLAAASSISIVAGVLAVMLLSGVGFSIAAIMNPSFYFDLIEQHFIGLVLGLALLGVSLGALFSATRFLGAVRAAGLAAIVSLVVALTGSLFFWNQITSYTVLALGYVVGVSAAGLLSSKSRGSKLGVGFEYAKKAMIAMAIISFVGTLAVVAMDPEPYKDQFVEGVTGIAVMSLDLDDATIEQLVREKSPKMEWETFRDQIAEDYDDYTEADKIEVQGMYDDYSANYEAQVAIVVQETQDRLAASGETADTLVRSMSFFEIIFENIALAYAITMLSIFLLPGTIFIAPIAGVTSLFFHHVLPSEAHPKPKEKAPPVWEDDKIQERHKKLEKLEQQEMAKDAKKKRPRAR